jgi:hypothetical protein
MLICITVSRPIADVAYIHYLLHAVYVALVHSASIAVTDAVSMILYSTAYIFLVVVPMLLVHAVLCMPAHPQRVVLHAAHYRRAPRFASLLAYTQLMLCSRTDPFACMPTHLRTLMHRHAYTKKMGYC